MSSAIVSEDQRIVVSSQEEDLLQRSKKKVKDPDVTKSYKDSLLKPLNGMIFGDESNVIVQEETMIDINDMPKKGDFVLSHPKGPVISISDEELAMWSAPWRNTLVIQVLGKRVSFKTIENKLHHTWTKNGGIKIIDMHDGYYQVVLKSEEDYKHALFEGPWKVADHYLIVQRWRPLFLMNAGKVRKVAAWIRIPSPNRVI